MTDKEFIDTYNECYPFERYIVRNPEKINDLFLMMHSYVSCLFLQQKLNQLYTIVNLLVLHK